MARGTDAIRESGQSMTDQERADELFAAMRVVVRLERRKVALDHMLALARQTLREATEQACLQDRFSAVTGRKGLS